MDILAKLNSGEIHAKARAARPDCVDKLGNIHCSQERAQFVDWVAAHGKDHPEYVTRYVPSH